MFSGFEMSEFWAPIYLSYIIGLQTISNSYLVIFHNTNSFLSAIFIPLHLHRSLFFLVCMCVCLEEGEVP